jgi:hypothetical protein
MGAFTFSQTFAGRDAFQGKTMRGTLTGPASYDTGGSAVSGIVQDSTGLAPGTNEDERFASLDGAVVLSHPAAARYGLQFIAATRKFLVRDFDATDGGDEVASTTDLSAQVWTVEFRGR